jgi:phage FluMu gp28-like protein
MSETALTLEQALKTELPATDAGSFSAEVPAVLLPYQQAWVADQSQLKVSEKSRRIGLTWAEASDCVLAAASSRVAGGQNAYYIGYNKDMAIEFIDACAMWARVFGQAASEIEEGEEIFEDGKDDKAIKTFTIRFASGFRIVALSSRPANLRGKQGIVVIDEAAFHNDVEELLKAAMALLIWGGKVRVISTHDGDQNPFNELVNEIRSGKRKGKVHRTTFHEAVSQGLYDRVCLRKGVPNVAEEQVEWVEDIYSFYSTAAEEELDVVPSQGSGAWLTTALIEARMTGTPVLRYTAPKGFEQLPDFERTATIDEWLRLEVDPLLRALNVNWSSVFGLDFGRSGDLTSIVVGQIDQQLVRQVPFLVELRNMPHAQQKQILFHIVDGLPRFVKGALDARGNGEALAEFAAQQYGFDRIELIKASENWYREHMPPVKSAFEDATITLPRDKDVLADLRAVKLIKGVPRVPDARSTGKDGGQRHGDTAIAIAFMYYASRFPGAEIEFTPVPRHSRGFDNVRGPLDDDISLPEPHAW